ncbi:MAG: cytochrome c biogenesis protein CcdA [Hyphomicrobiaceae bacterium]|nr:cytochrome c biogenesis protein CcdA [Hyphomicrobiaceae bacterium]
MLSTLSLYLGVGLAGLVSFLSPCVLPLVPPYLGYLGGMTLEQMTDEKGIDTAAWRRVVVASVCFVLGFSTVFIGLGAGASAFGQVIQTYKAELAMLAGVVIILFGLHFLGILRIPLLYQEARYHTEMQGASYLGSYLIGLAFAFGWTPCVGPILATVLTVAANEASLATGIKLLAAYSLGLGIPFILAAVAIGPFMGFMKRFRRHMARVEQVMGVVLVVTGLLFAGEALGWIKQALVAAAPGLAAASGWIGLALVAAGIVLLLRQGRHVRLSGLVGLMLGMTLIGGSINVLGQWLIENVPVLGQLEELTTSKELQTEILKQGVR